MLKQRVITALILGAAALLAIFFLPDAVWGVVVGAVVVLALREWSAMMALPGALVAALSVVVAAPAVLAGFFPPQGAWRVALAVAYGCALVLWAVVVPLWLRHKPRLLGAARGGVGAVLLFVPASLALVELRRASPGLLVLAILAVCVADIGAYFVGRAWGKNKLAPTISPGKSWEGFYGGVSGVILFFLAAFFWAMPAALARFGAPVVALLGLLYALASVEGDLFESLIKRQAGVKDSGNLLPGHGGVLDRVDSMLSTLPLAGALLLFWQQG